MLICKKETDVNSTDVYFYFKVMLTKAVALLLFYVGNCWFQPKPNLRMILLP